MTPAKFIAKWSPVTLSERAASQEPSSTTPLALPAPWPYETRPITEGRKSRTPV